MLTNIERTMVMTDRDLDFAWLRAMLESQQASAQPFAYIPGDILQTGLALLSHVVARHEHRKIAFSRGVRAVYALLCGDVWPEEELMRTTSRHTGYPLVEVSRMDPVWHVFWRDEKFEWLLEVPWTLALASVGSRACPLVEGKAYVSRHQLPDTMADLWLLAVRRWAEWDRRHVVEPLVEESYRRYAVGDAERFGRELHEAAARLLAKPPFPHLAPQYSEHLAACRPRVYAQDYGLDAMGSLAEYRALMPPCLRSVADRHSADRTHHNWTERFQLFLWCFLVRCPAPVLEDYWRALVDADPVASRRTDLHHLPAATYASLERKSEAPRYHRCESMGSSCPFLGEASPARACAAACGLKDIEDIAYWNPMRATRVQKSFIASSRSAKPRSAPAPDSSHTDLPRR